MADLSKLREALATLDLATDKIKSGERSIGDWGVALDSQMAVIDAAREVAAQADAQPAVSAVPEGWVMVPRTGTPEMKFALRAWFVRECGLSVKGMEDKFMAEILGAAPAAPASEGVVICWTDRHARVARFALHRFISEAMNRATAAAQDKEGRHFKPGAAKAFDTDAADASEALRLLAAAKPGEVGL